MTTRSKQSRDFESERLREKKGESDRSGKGEAKLGLLAQLGQSIVRIHPGVCPIVAKLGGQTTKYQVSS